jgi:transposase-like protein
MTHKSEDYKISAVKYYLKNKDNIRKTCKIFDCKKSTLHRWIKRYETSKNLTRRNRKPISYKITKPQVKTALELLKQNEQLTMNELSIDMKKQYPTFDISPQHLGQVIRDNNRTRKRTRHEHFPKKRYKNPIDKQSEMKTFYKKIKEYPIHKIICLDETSVGSALHPIYSRCYLGKRCKIKTSNQFVFRKFTLLVAISNSKIVGKELYEKGGMTAERFLKFLEKNIFPYYKGNLIVLDNAKSHNNELIKNAIIKSGNDYLFAVPYTPKTNNPIEAYFNQIKTYMKKNRNVENYEKLENNIDDAIDRVKPENYKNYFQHAYGLDESIEFIRKPSTLKRKLKNYK